MCSVLILYDENHLVMCAWFNVYTNSVHYINTVDLQFAGIIN